MQNLKNGQNVRSEPEIDHTTKSEWSCSAARPEPVQLLPVPQSVCIDRKARRRESAQSLRNERGSVERRARKDIQFPGVTARKMSATEEGKVEEKNDEEQPRPPSSSSSQNEHGSSDSNQISSKNNSSVAGLEDVLVDVSKPTAAAKFNEKEETTGA
eukprot:2138573-Rhodomonas_salina.1